MSRNSNSNGARNQQRAAPVEPDNAPVETPAPVEPDTSTPPEQTDVNKEQQAGTPAASDTSTPRAQTDETLNPPLITEAPEQDDGDNEQAEEPLLDTLRDKQEDDATVAPGTDRANAEKISVKTGGNYMFQDPYTLEVVDAGATTSITKTTAVETAIAEGRLIEA